MKTITMEKQIAKSFIRLINERPHKLWYMKKSQHSDEVDWAVVANILTEAGYNVEDQGDLVKGYK